MLSSKASSSSADLPASPQQSNSLADRQYFTLGKAGTKIIMVH